ncbi:metal ABC transporter permease [Ligilactobacillus sp. Marseille-Q7487]|uniref:metal ABC transporter permease n=1 Tax=Ligilactobacillus sp. Marseille-Q7487 TaxID=3022128 RepID=UPI0024A9F123|nr:metal ABC transporter permease [Ligilactobacillus sp. Marseille-Q7487]
MKVIGEFLDGLQHYGFLQSALIASLLVGVMAGLVGCFIILRGMALMGDAISHSVLPGVALAHIFGINLLLGASLFGILASLVIGFIAEKSKLKTDTSIGIVFSAFYALGFILIAQAESTANLHHILFGNVLAVSGSDLRSTVLVLAVVILFIVLFYKELLISSFDPIYAKTYGLNTRVLHYALMLLLTLVTVSALQTVGIILVVAMLITPAATAFLWTNNLVKMLILAATFGASAAFLGLFFSYTFNWASGPAIVLVAAAIFLVTFWIAPKQGLLKFK